MMDLQIVKTGAKAVVSTTNTITVSVTHAVIPVINIQPAAPVVPDTTAPGTTIAKATVTNNDGSPYTGTLAISSQTVAGEFVLAREGTTNVWDINVGMMAIGAAMPMLTLTATE
jgi:hypothetical protein